MRLLRTWVIPVSPPESTSGAVELTVVDAMNEAAWCLLEGFGCKKDKVTFLPFPQISLGASQASLTLRPPQFAAARYYRLAEKNGHKTLGNSWYVRFPIHPGLSSRTPPPLHRPPTLGPCLMRAPSLAKLHPANEHHPHRIWKDKYGPPEEPSTAKK